MADEPTGNLNSDAGQQVMDSLEQVRNDFGTTVVLVTHDSLLADQADRKLTLVDGRLLS
jgi:predicted ABC-type transport system involved in lysophospholipase L1 biosynthesis ATPase subunit